MKLFQGRECYFIHAAVLCFEKCPGSTQQEQSLKEWNWTKLFLLNSSNTCAEVTSQRQMYTHTQAPASALLSLGVHRATWAVAAAACASPAPAKPGARGEPRVCGGGSALQHPAKALLFSAAAPCFLRTRKNIFSPCGPRLRPRTRKPGRLSGRQERSPFPDAGLLGNPARVCTQESGAGRARRVPQAAPRRARDARDAHDARLGSNSRGEARTRAPMSAGGGEPRLRNALES